MIIPYDHRWSSRSGGPPVLTLHEHNNKFIHRSSNYAQSHAIVFVSKMMFLLLTGRAGITSIPLSGSSVSATD